MNEAADPVADSLLWSQMSMAKTAYSDVVGAASQLECLLCEDAAGWLDYDVWLLRHPAELVYRIGTQAVYLCKGCLKADGDKDLWVGAVLLAIERSMIGNKPPPVFVSVCSPKLRHDNHRCRWLEFI